MPTPYQISLLNNNIYYFTTDYGLNYICGFSNITSKLSPVIKIYDIQVYDFELYAHDPRPEIRKPMDERIPATVVDVLQAFFINSLRILTYVCDSADGRAKERQALFKKWHSNIAAAVNRDEVEIKFDTETIYGCILSRKDFPYMDVLKTELIDPERGFIVQKFEA